MEYADKAPPQQEDFEKNSADHLEQGSGSVNTADQDELAALEKSAKLTGYVIYLSTVAGLAGFLFGYDTGVIGVALTSMSKDLNITNPTVQEWITSSLSCGALFGALVGGTSADKIGRKKILMIGDLLFVVGAVLIAAAPAPKGIAMVFIGRVILGFGVGIASSVAPVYIAEVAPSRFRGALVTIQSIAITGGQFISYCLGIPLKGHNGWRYLFVIAIAPALIQAVGVHFLPESPRYDLIKGEKERARKTLDNVYKSPNPRLVELKMAELEILVGHVQAFRQQYNTRQQFALIAKQGYLRRPAVTALGLCVFQQLCGFNTLLYYSGIIFNSVGFKNPATTGLFVPGCNVLFTVIAMFILDRVGKRRILILGYPGMIIGLGLAALAFAKMTAGSGTGDLIAGYDYPKKWTSLMFGMFVLFIASYATGLGNIPWQGNELFPLHLRGTGAAILSAGVWAANIFISASFLSIMNGIGAAGAFGFYAGICVVGYVFVFFCYPEVSGLSLEEVEEIFRHGFGIRKSQEIRAAHKVAKELYMSQN